MQGCVQTTLGHHLTHDSLAVLYQTPPRALQVVDAHIRTYSSAATGPWGLSLRRPLAAEALRPSYKVFQTVPVSLQEFQ